MNAFPSLTRSQELILLGQQLAPESPLNNMAFSFTFRESVDVERLRSAFAQLVQACDAMRATIRGGKMIVQPGMDYELPYFPDSKRYEELMNEAVRTVFKLEERLFDAALFQAAPDHYVLYFNQHHLITDGWGYAVQMDYLLAVYQGGEPEPLPSFADYVARMTADKTLAKTLGQAQTWKELVATYPGPPALFGRVNPDRSAVAVRIIRRLTKEQTDLLLSVCQQPDVRAWTTDLALFNVLLTAVFTYMCRISGQHDLSLGAPAHNRLTANDKKTAGLAMELFPLRASLEPTDTLGDVLNKVKLSSMEFLKNAHPGSSSAETGRSFNVLLNFINQSFHDGERAITSDWIHSGQMEPGHHLRIQVYDFDKTGQLTFCFDLNESIIPEEMHEAVAEGFLEVLWQIVNDRSTPLHDLTARDRSFLAAAEWAGNDTYPTDLTVVDLIEEQVEKTPDKVSIRFSDRIMTFRELNDRANQLARQLGERGIERGDVVPLCLDRSMGMMVGLLGIIKAGAAYLPIDPALPDDRITFIVKDAEAKLFVGNEESAVRLASLPELDIVVLNPEGQLSVAENLASSNLPPHLRPRPNDLIYVLYTSGSTGTPKGVMNQHDGLVNQLEWARRDFISGDLPTVMLQKTTFTFDVSAWELFLPLISGAELVLAKPGGEKDTDYLKKIVVDYGITMLHFVPPMLESFLLKKALLPSLRTVICSGEALLPHQANTLRELYPGVALHNLYGPTEAAIHVTQWRMPEGKVSSVPIGEAVTNVRLRVYGPEGQVRPLGVPGELYLGGVQVARGYLKRPELTAEKFVQRDGHRWYRTGDLVRWQPNGNLEFLGRIDHQVKLRGFRIELGEVEACLLDDPKVSQTVVLLKKDAKGEPALVAYVVGEGEDPRALRAGLSAKLPAYMVPGLYVFLESLPLLPNGKINRKALPEPSFDLSSAAQGDAPRGDFEEMVHTAWQEVFRLEAIGRDTHFLDVGGHSLTGIRMMNRINEDFQLQLPANTIFRYPTIAGMAEHIERTIRELLAGMDKS